MVADERPQAAAQELDAALKKTLAEIRSVGQQRFIGGRNVKKRPAGVLKRPAKASRVRAREACIRVCNPGTWRMWVHIKGAGIKLDASAVAELSQSYHRRTAEENWGGGPRAFSMST